MISVCVPVYNYNIASLINELKRQSAQIDAEIQIIAIDDGSKHFKVENKKCVDRIEYIELAENVGRAKIRNLFLNHAKHNYLLFLDCDGIIEKESFLENYIKAINDNPNVVCGGRVYPKEKPSKNKLLSWKNGVCRESKPANERRKAPNQSFMTNNFLIKRSVLEKIKFDERLVGYGHEDTMFGFELEKNNIAIKHIENPVLNGDIEENDVFLQKTEQAIQNLVRLKQFMSHDEEFVKSVRLLSFYSETKSFHKLILFINFVFGRLNLWLLKSGVFTIKMFDFYKLVRLIKFEKNAKLHQK